MAARASRRRSRSRSRSHSRSKSRSKSRSHSRSHSRSRSSLEELENELKNKLSELMHDGQYYVEEENKIIQQYIDRLKVQSIDECDEKILSAGETNACYEDYYDKNPKCNECIKKYKNLLSDEIYSFDNKTKRKMMLEEIDKLLVNSISFGGKRKTRKRKRILKHT